MQQAWRARRGGAQRQHKLFLLHMLVMHAYIDAANDVHDQMDAIFTHHQTYNIQHHRK
jgi:1,4-dihydroxy-2-naphthoate octaprenyltransferase